jgi:putative tributyrin esterase
MTRTTRLAAALLALSTGCAGARQDRLAYASLDSEALGRAMRYGVYTPPGWDGREPLPLVVFLHGAGDDERAFDRHGSYRELDDWIAAGRLPPFAMVVPDGGLGFWANWYDGSYRYDDYVEQEVLPAVRGRYPILPGRRDTHLLGISMGGAGAIYGFLEHKQRFASVTVVSAPLYDVDATMRFLGSFLFRVFARIQRVFGPPERERVARANIFTRVGHPADLEGARLIIGAGTEDNADVALWTRRFHEHLRDRRVPHRYATFPGPHRWRTWRPVLPRLLCLQLAPDRCELPPMDGFRSIAVDG